MYRKDIYILFIVLLVVSAVQCLAQDAIEGRFSRESFSLGQNTLPYRKAEICQNGVENSALVLYLHGGSARGNDNEKQLSEAAVSIIYEYLLDHEMSAIFVVPQCPSGGGWTSQNRKVVNELLKSYVNAGKVDDDRVYVMGGSMGGTGTWCQLSYFPDFYAAAMPVAGNPTGMNAENVATTPVLTVMGTADTMMSIENVETFMADVIAAGGFVQLEIEEGWSHPTTCEQSYSNERLDWIFSQVRGQATGNVSPISKTEESSLYDLQGRKLDKIMHLGIYIKDGKKVLLKKN